MNTLSLKEATTNLPNIVAETIQNNDETFIVSDKGTVIMIDQNYG